MFYRDSWLNSYGKLDSTVKNVEMDKTIVKNLVKIIPYNKILEYEMIHVLYLYVTNSDQYTVL
jgi:hypothetical protein